MSKLVEAAPRHVESVRKIFVDAVTPEDFEAIGRAMAAVLAVDIDEESDPRSESGERGPMPAHLPFWGLFRWLQHRSRPGTGNAR